VSIPTLIADLSHELRDSRCDDGVGSLEVVATAVDPAVLDLRRHRRRPSGQLVRWSEWVTRPRDEQTGHADGWQMLDSQPIGLGGRVQGIGDQHQTSQARNRAHCIDIGGNHRHHSAPHRSAAHHQWASPATHRREIVANRRHQRRCPVRGASSRSPVGKVESLHRGRTSEFVLDRHEAGMIACRPSTRIQQQCWLGHQR